MSATQRLIDKIQAELKNEKNPFARSALLRMNEYWSKKPPSQQIVDMFSTIRDAKSPEQQAEEVKETEIATKAAIEDDFQKTGPSYAKVLPEKLNLELLQDRVGLRLYRDPNKKPLTKEMDALVFGAKGETTAQNATVNMNAQDASIDLTRPKESQPMMTEKLHTTTDESSDMKARMYSAALKAGIDTSNFVKPAESAPEDSHVKLSAPKPEEVTTAEKNIANAADLLEEGADVYRGRNATYGDSYKKQGKVLAALFPNGVTINSVKDFNRITILTTIVSKLLRYSNDFNKPHDDSILDNMVYFAMLLEIDRSE